MIVERSKANDNWPKVHAMNTFFYPKLVNSGYALVRRWTKKVHYTALEFPQASLQNPESYSNIFKQIPQRRIFHHICFCSISD